MYSVICKRCGQKVSGATKNALMDNMNEHFREEHNMETPSDILTDIENMVKRRMDEGL